MEGEPGAQPVTEITDEEVAEALGSSAFQRLVPPVAERSGEELVRLSGLQRVTSHHYGDFGFQAASELIRRLTEELRHSREQAKASAEKREDYTAWLVRLTVVLVILTVALVGHAVISIMEDS
jgi:hypothetical protein